MGEKWERVFKAVAEKYKYTLDADLRKDCMFVTDYTLKICRNLCV